MLRALAFLLILSGCDVTTEEWAEINTALDGLNRATSRFANQVNPPQYQKSTYQLQNEYRLEQLEREIQRLEFEERSRRLGFDPL